MGSVDSAFDSNRTTPLTSGSPEGEGKGLEAGWAASGGGDVPREQSEQWRGGRVHPHLDEGQGAEVGHEARRQGPARGPDAPRGRPGSAALS